MNPLALRAANDVFLTRHPEVRVPELVHDQCHVLSRIYLEFLTDRGYIAWIVSGVQMQDDVVLQGHFAVQVEGIVIDWTYRQFDPTAPTPRVRTLTEWRQEWPSFATPTEEA